MKKNRTNEDYLHIFHIYVYRWLAYFVLLIILVLILLVFHKDLGTFWRNITNQDVDATTFLYNDVELARFEGKVKILNDRHVLIYQGLFSKGACNGKGTIYDETGKKLYEGIMVNNNMDDNEGTLYYDEDHVAYIGEIHNNFKQGKGVLYRRNGTKEYEGDFVLDKFEGSGKYYDKQGHIQYEGEFLNDMRHGEGKLYEEGAYSRMLYQGEFAFGYPQGVGTLYDTFGKAYYTGAMFEGHINYTAYLSTSLEDLEACFKEPYDIYVYNNKTAIVYPDEKLVFFTQYPIPIEKNKNDWSLKRDIQKKDVILESAILVDRNIDSPDVDFTMDDILTTWQSKYVSHTTQTLMDEHDVFGIYFTNNIHFTNEKDYFTCKEHKNRIYELKYDHMMELSTRIMYPVTKYSIGYVYPIYEDQLVYSIMMDEKLKVNIK